VQIKNVDRHLLWGNMNSQRWIFDTLVRWRISAPHKRQGHAAIMPLVSNAKSITGCAGFSDQQSHRRFQQPPERLHELRALDAVADTVIDAQGALHARADF
jgi:hypothetical protein